MENNQFEKIDGKNKIVTKRKVLVFLIAITVIVFSVLTANSVYAYFTAKSEINGDVRFGTIAVNLLDKNSSTYSEKSFKEYHLTNLIPGSSLDFSGINVKNTGTCDEFVLINLDISIPSNNVGDLHYNKWYNVDGMEVNSMNMTTNETKATLITAGATKTTNIKWSVPRYALDSNYCGATAQIKITAYGTQTLLADSALYVDEELYAAYFICSNAANIASDNGLTFPGEAVRGEPLKKLGSVSDSYDFDSSTITKNVKMIELTGEESWGTYNFIVEEGISFYLEIADKKAGLQTSTCSHFENVNWAWGSNYSDSTGIYSDNDTSKYVYFRAPNANITTATQFTNWLKAEKASGNAVKLWYQSENPSIEKFESSKNLYNGEQYLHFKTAATDNNISEKGEVLITYGATQNFENMELGGDVFNYIKDKPFTISFKLRRHVDDAKLESVVGVSFLSNTTVKTTYEKYADKIEANGCWGYYWITIPAMTTIDDYESFTSIKIKLIDHSGSPNSHFDIHNLQIETGSAPTNFENYDSTEYARINDTVLRRMGEVKDTYDTTAKKINRWVLKLELTGTNDAGYWEVLTNATTANSIGVYYASSSVLGSNNAATFVATPAKSSHFEYTDSSLQNQNDTLVNKFSAVIAGNPPHIAFKLPFTTLKACKDWVNEEYQKGRPVTVWLVRSAAIQE